MHREADVEAQWTKLFGDWLRAGEITFPRALIPGIENAPQALQDAITGRHLGMSS